MAEATGSSEVLPVSHHSEVYGGKWNGFLAVSPQGTAIWISIPSSLLGKGKRYFYDAEKKTLQLPAGSGYDVKPVDFAMGLSMLSIFDK